jgi:8-oxo-dGTP pyrophosphatase MutT (NUDIX family)
MVQRRSAFAHEGGTWSCAGGALDEGESPLVGPFGASINFETDDVAWLPLDEVDRLPLHAGFAAAWPQLREIAQQAE